eukprot:1886708-Amphidinium_carterae.1
MPAGGGGRVPHHEVLVVQAQVRPTLSRTTKLVSTVVGVNLGVESLPASSSLHAELWQLATVEALVSTGQQLACASSAPGTA